MTNLEFLEKMDYLYQNYEEDSAWRNSKLSDELSLYLTEHIQDDDLHSKISIKDYKVVEDAVYLYTDIGTFLMENKNPDLDTLEKLRKQSIRCFDFFYKLESGNLTSTFIDTYNNLFCYYLSYYYNYRNLTEPNRIDRLFKSYMSNRYCLKAFPSLETLNHPNFQNFCLTSLKKVSELKRIYHQYYSFEKNQKLVFSMFILSEDYERIEYFEKNLEAFKKFIMEEASKARHLSEHIKICCRYLKKSNLIKRFSEEELLTLYQRNTSYYLNLPDEFERVIKKVENKSPTIYLDSTKKEKVHIQYLSYQFIEGVPFDYYTRYKTREEERLNFKNLFLYNNRVISNFYRMYFKKYQKQIGKEGNLFDFIGYLFHTECIISIYNNPNIKVADIHELEQFLPFYDKKVQRGVVLAKEELRKRNLSFYNSLVKAKDDSEKFDEILLQSGLKEENIYSFIVQNKFLDKKKKEGLLTIVRNHFGEGYSIFDILSLIEEAKSREISLEVVLGEKEISKKAFQEMYQYAEKDNPILYQCMFDAMQQPKRKLFMNFLRLGCHVAGNNVKDIREYKEKFPDGPSYYDLIKQLEDTTIAQKLIEKANHFEDFDLSVVNKQLKKK